MDMNIQALPVATHLPSGYLSIQPLGLGKGVRIRSNKNVYFYIKLKTVFQLILQY